MVHVRERFTITGKGALYLRIIFKLYSHAYINIMIFLKIVRSYSPHISLLRSFKEFSGVLRCRKGEDCIEQGLCIFKEYI